MVNVDRDAKECAMGENKRKEAHQIKSLSSKEIFKPPLPIF
jgi:hypothetical protein